MNNLDIKDLGPIISRAFRRFHIVLFAVIALGGISLLVFSAYQIVVSVIDPGEPAVSTQASFDQATIQRLESLSEKSGTSRPLNFPENQRINPFSE